MRLELQRAAELAAAYLDELATCRVASDPDVAELRRALDVPLSDQGEPGVEVLEHLARDARPGILDSASGRFFGWVIGGSVPAALGADWLTSAWDQNAAAFACSPTAAILEDIAAGWLKEILRLPPSASFAFVTGCQMAHFTCLAAARHRLLERCGHNVEKQGLFGAPGVRVVVGEHHETLLRAIRLLGIGTDSVVRVAQLEDGTIDVEALGQELDGSRQPTIVAVAAGDLNRGAFDPFGRVCEVAHQHDAWVHVDGAFGLWAAASERFRHLVRGIEQADSWATDAHKWLNVPYDSGLAFVADAEAHKAAMTIPAAYKVEVDGVRDQFEWGPEWSRRARGIPVYAALRVLGRNGVARMIDECCDRAQQLFAGISELDGAEILATPIINQGLVRFLDPDGDHDARTERVIERINATGEAWFGPTTWRGMRVMRVSVSNWQTSETDIERALAAIALAMD